MTDMKPDADSPKPSETGAEEPGAGSLAIARALTDGPLFENCAHGYEIYDSIKSKAECDECRDRVVALALDAAKRSAHLADARAGEKLVNAIAAECAQLVGEYPDGVARSGAEFFAPYIRVLVWDALSLLGPA